MNETTMRRAPVRRRFLVAGAAVGAAAYGAGIREIRAQVRRHRADWERANLETLRRLREQETWKPYLVVALGDSATQGVGTQKIEEGYVPRLGQKLSGDLRQQVAVLNLSVSGATAQTVLASQIPHLVGLGVKPDQVVLNIGGNDVGVKNLSVEEFREQSAELLAELPRGTLVGNIPSFGFLRVDERAQELSAALDSEADTAGHVPVDLRSFTSNLSAPNYLFRYHAADLFHPNFRAYEAWAETFWKKWREQQPQLEGKHDAAT